MNKDMKLQTPVTDIACRNQIGFDNRILMIGSCFSDNIGTILSDYGFNVAVNPFGTLYNPVSVTNALKRLEGGWPFAEDDCVEMGSGAGLICSFRHHTSFARKTAEEFLANANKSLAEAADFYKNCDRIIITLGTNRCYRNIQSGEIVSNCLKRPAYEFDIQAVQPTQIAAMLSTIVEKSDKKFIFTVSPIRHFKDGAHINQLSKAALLTGVDMLCNAYPDRCDYFPAYEIMMDELRDYRFYAEDMVHPSDQAVKYIAERFLGWALPKEESHVLEENIKRYKRSRHIQKF